MSSHLWWQKYCYIVLVVGNLVIIKNYSNDVGGNGKLVFLWLIVNFISCKESYYCYLIPRKISYLILWVFFWQNKFAHIIFQVVCFEWFLRGNNQVSQWAETHKYFPSYLLLQGNSVCAKNYRIKINEYCSLICVWSWFSRLVASHSCS